MLSRVVEDEEQLSIVERAVPGASIRVFRLVAAPDTVAARLATREVGSGLDRHIQRSHEIARTTLGEPVEAERGVVEVATDILRRAGWIHES